MKGRPFQELAEIDRDDFEDKSDREDGLNKAPTSEGYQPRFPNELDENFYDI